MTQLTNTVFNYSPEAIDTAIALWAQKTTGDSPRQMDLLRDKSTAVGEFFAHAKLHPAAVRAIARTAIVVAMAMAAIGILLIIVSIQ